MQLKRFAGFLGIVLVAGFFASGCGSRESDADGSLKLDGRWLLSITQEYGRADYRDVSTVLLRITQNDGGYQAKIEGNQPALPDAVLEDFNVTGDRVKFVLESNGYTYDFEGVVQGSVIRGNIDQGGLVIEPARLERTEIIDISEAIEFPAAARNLEYQVLVESASQGKGDRVSLSEHYEGFNEFTKKFADAPLAVIVSHNLVNVAPRQAKSEAEIKAFAEEYLTRAAHWGERMEMLARYNLGRSLCRDPEYAGLGLGYLDKAESQMDASRREELKDELAEIRHTVEANKIRARASKAFSLAKTGDKKALEAFRELSDDSPFDPVVIYQRAEAARLLGETDEALRMNARLATWPRMQGMLQQEPVWLADEKKLPDALFMDLYAKQHGGTEGLEEYKNKIFGEAIAAVADQLDRPKTAPKGDRISVVELFTGAGCMPCIAADLATSALEDIYPSSHLIVLRHHLHSAGFDPLTHPSNMGRFENLLDPDQQDFLATPTVFLNGGRAKSSVGGSLKDAVRVGRDLQSELRPILDESSPLKLDLAATRQGDQITISAKVDGATGEQRNQIRLHLVLAEEVVDYAAANGIRQHEMLTRWFAGEGNGIAFADSNDQTYRGEVLVDSDIRDVLQDSNESAAKALDAELTSAPLLLEKLNLVGFVQHAETREILQARVVPVEVIATPSLELPKFEASPANGPSFGPTLQKPEFNSDPGAQ